MLLSIVERRASAPVTLLERACITRLGAGVDAHGRLAPEACARTLDCLREYAAELRAHGVDAGDLAVVGTSALRDASGSAAFLDDAERLLDVRPRVIAGVEEAELTFTGATSGLALEGRVLVFDVGGGSTEVVLGELDAGASRISSARSLDVGSVRLFERHVRSDPPSPSELAGIAAEVAHALGEPPALAPPWTLVGVAGTVTTLATIERGLGRAAPGLVHGARMSRERLHGASERLKRLTLAERLALPELEPGRADVIPVGAAIVCALVDWCGARELVVSDRGVRWGALERLLTV